MKDFIAVASLLYVVFVCVGCALTFLLSIYLIISIGSLIKIGINKLFKKDWYIKNTAIEILIEFYRTITLKAIKSKPIRIIALILLVIAILLNIDAAINGMGGNYGN